MLRRLLVVLVLAPAAACGSTVPDPGGPVTQEDLEALPTVEEAAAGELEASDGETTQTAAVVALDPDADEDAMRTATSLSSDTGIDDDVLSRWVDLVAAEDPAGDQVAPFHVFLDVADGATSASVRWHLAAQGARGRRPVHDPQGDPADITPQVWGPRLEPAVDGVVDVADDGTTERWSVSVSELSDPLASLVELEDDSPRPGFDALGRTWNRDAWDRWRDRSAA